MIGKLREKFADDAYAKRLGIELIELEPGRARAKMTLDPGHLNFNGFIHGGALFSLMDVVFAAASNSHNESAVAIDLGVNFINAPGPSGVLYGEAREIDRSRKLGLYELTVRDETGKLLCRSEGRVYRIGKPVLE